MSNSVSIEIKPQDSRCRFWAKVLRKDTALPLPSAVNGANDVPGIYRRAGEEELEPGDCLLTGEEMHHRKARGWTYNLFVVSEAGELVKISNPGADEKAEMKAAGMPVDLLKGSGEVAACIRLLHGIRQGFYKI